MPELPEVETIVRGLDEKLKGRKIIKVEILDSKVSNLSAGKITKEIVGLTIKGINRRAKMVIIDLSEKYVLIHLKMTGQLVLINKNKRIAGDHLIAGEEKIFPNKFTRAVFEFAPCASGRTISQSRGTAARPLKLYFNDIRRFGWIKLVDADGLNQISADLGIEPLSSDFTLEKFKKILSRKQQTSIKQVLMDQKYIAGIGNIYSDEILFKAKINPFRKVGSLSESEVKAIWRAIPKVLRFAIKHRGTSFSDYIDAKGEVGNFIKYLKVYGKDGVKCQECGIIIKKAKIGGRSAHWCEKCQD